MKETILLFVFGAVVANLSLASTFTMATSTIGSATCSQTGSGTSNCSQTVGFDTVGSSATSNISSTSGLLDVIVNTAHSAGGFNATPSGTAAASFNVPLIVTGGIGTGVLVANFFGFDSIISSGGSLTNPVLSLTLGSTVTTFTPGGGGNFSFSTPFTFGTPFTFNASISGAAQTPLLMANAPAFADVEGRVSLTGFSIVNSAGQSINGVVSIVPEPSLMGIVGAGMLALAVYSRRRARERACGL